MVVMPAHDADDLRARIARVRARIGAAAERVGRDPASVTLVAISKTQPPGAVLAAHGAGLCDFGENRVQEAARTIGELRDRAQRGTSSGICSTIRSPPR